LGRRIRDDRTGDCSTSGDSTDRAKKLSACYHFSPPPSNPE
jgi:hypothetical protein